MASSSAETLDDGALHVWDSCRATPQASTQARTLLFAAFLNLLEREIAFTSGRPCRPLSFLLLLIAVFSLGQQP
jgi:hypothetical protein